MSNETETDKKTTVQILNACEHQASPDEIGPSVDGLPPAEAPAKLEPLAQGLLDLVAAGSDWQTWEDLSASLNAGRAISEHVAQGPIETALADLFHAALVEMKDENGARRWREDRDRAVARRSILLARLALTLGEGATIETLMSELAQTHDVVDADIGALVDAGLVALVDDAAKLKVDANGNADIWRFAAAEASHERDRDEAAVVRPGEVQTLISESAGWRQKYEAERRRAIDLESWIGRKGFSAQDALDEVRGVTVIARPKREEFTFVDARVVNDAEKGVILGEIIEIDQQIAAIRGELEVMTGERKTRIKELTKKIEGLKSDAACNRRTVEWLAYKVTDWKAGVVRSYRSSDDLFLTEEAIPKGSQRTIETDAKTEQAPAGGPASLAEAVQIAGAATAAFSTAILAAMSNEELAQTASDAEPLGIRIQLDLNQKGAARIVSIAGGEQAAPVVEASKLAFPTGEAELAEAVFALFTSDPLNRQPKGYAFTFDAIQVALDLRFDVPAGCGKRVELALDRLVERGAIEVADEGMWKLVAIEPGPLSLPADPKAAAPAPATEKPKRGRKAKPEARAT